MPSFRRFDLYDISKPVRLNNGWFRTDATITRIGVFEYRRPDGSIRRELRHPDEVFHKDALASFELVPVVVDHPAVGILDTSTTRQYQRGSVANVRRDGTMVKADVLLTDENSIEAATIGGKNQISCGYVCDCDETPGITSGIPGVLDGEHYDAIQKNIRGNHVALVSHGRAGEGANLRLDSEGNGIHEDGGPGSGPRPSGNSKSAIADRASGKADHTRETDDHEKAALAHKEALKEAKKSGNSDAIRHHRQEMNSHKEIVKARDANSRKEFLSHFDSEGDSEMKIIKVDGKDVEVDDEAAKEANTANVQKAGKYFGKHMDDQKEGHDHEAAHGKTVESMMNEGHSREDAMAAADHARDAHSAGCDYKEDFAPGADPEGDDNDDDDVDGEGEEDGEMKPKAREDSMKIVLAGQKFNVTPALHKSLSDVAVMAAAGEKQKARADAAEEKLAEFPKLVASRIALISSAAKILPKDHKLKLDEMTDMEIMSQSLAVKFPKLELKGKSVDYVQARFDSAVETVTVEVPNVALDRIRSAGNRSDSAEGDAIDLDAKRAKMGVDGRRHANSPKEK